MKFSTSPKRLAMYACLAAFAVVCILMLAFSTIYMSDDITQYYNVKPDNGFKWMSFKSNMLRGSTWDVAKVPIAILSIAQLVFGLGAVATVVSNFVSNKDDSNKKIIIGGLVSMTLYALEGIIVRSVYLDEMKRLDDYIFTASYIPLIIGVILLVAYCAVIKYMPGEISGETFSETIPVTATANVKNVPIALSESEKIESLAKYRNLLEQGVITQEEFDAKKKQLLDL